MVLALSGARAVLAAVDCPVPIKFVDQTRWCWAGSAQMVRAYYGDLEPTDHSKIYYQCNDARYAVAQGFMSGTNCCVPNTGNSSCNQGLWPQILSTNNCSIRDGVLSWDEIPPMMPGGQSCSPFIFAYTLPGGLTHYRVAVGYGGTNSANGYIHFNDPNPLLQNNTYISYADFAMNTTAVWYGISRTFIPWSH
ncbi:MAG: hypothetical protein JF616_22455 [Fibrobacteres bacterium]|nr:hypothetical protein [Fibrobacterota bacterium]